MGGGRSRERGSEEEEESSELESVPEEDINEAPATKAKSAPVPPDESSELSDSPPPAPSASKPRAAENWELGKGKSKGKRQVKCHFCERHIFQLDQHSKPTHILEPQLFNLAVLPTRWFDVEAGNPVRTSVEGPA